MSDNRIVLRLNQRIAFERDLGIQYNNMPRARRQEWIRSILRAGLAGIEGITQGAPVLAALSYAPNAAAIEALSAPAAIKAPPAPAAVAASAVVVKSEKPKTKSGDLKNFFGETKGTTP